MASRGTSFGKRERDRAKKEKQTLKAEKKAERAEATDEDAEPVIRRSMEDVLAEVEALHIQLDEGLIDYVCEIAGSLKIGKYMPGTQIPIVDEARLFEEQPDCAIIFSWHIADELARKLKAKGFRGKLITPLPEPRVL